MSCFLRTSNKLPSLTYSIRVSVGRISQLKNLSTSAQGITKDTGAQDSKPQLSSEEATTAAALQQVTTSYSEKGYALDVTERTVLGRPIYLDAQSTTPVDPRVLDAMLPYYVSQYGNPHSRTHFYGWATEDAVEKSRANVAALIGADPKEIIFTSGATESNNTAIKGVANFYKERKRHIITTQTEHKCVLDSCRHLQQNGFEITYLSVNKEGLVNLEDLKNAIRPDTILVSVMMVNNDIGVIQPIEEIGKICREHKVFFHTDAAQAVGKIPIDVEKMNIDLMSISGHKIYGPKGVGALYVRRKPRVRLEPIINGGGQERGLRSGTLPAPLVVGIGAACEVCMEEMERDYKHVSQLSERLIRQIRSSIPHVVLNGSEIHRYPGNVNFSFAYVEGESLLRALKKVAVSSGSACTSASLEPSYVLLRALGVDEDMAHTSIRFGIGRFTTAKEVDFTVELAKRHVARLRDMSPLWEMVQEGIDLKSIRLGKIDTFPKFVLEAGLLVALAPVSSSLYKHGHKYNAVVVDRERDVSLVTGLLYDLEYHRHSLSGPTSDPSYRVTLGFAPHLFGSGKTTFIQNFLSLVRRLGDSYLEDSSSDPSARSFLDKLKNAAFLYVDLSKLEPTIPVEEKRNLKWAIYYLMVKSACVNMGLSEPDKFTCYNELQLRSDMLVKKIRTILNTPPEQFLLVAFDEVGILDTKGRLFDVDVTLDGRIRPYNDFFRIIRELCEQPGLFFIVVGKSEGLSIQNYVSSVSRVLLKFIPLAPLQLHSIEEHLQQSTMLSSSGQSVADVLCNDNFSSNELAEMLLDFTGGVPGLMTRAIDQLLIHVRENGGVSLSKQECFAFLSMKDVQKSCVSSYLPRLYDLSEERSTILNMLIMMALYHIRFRSSDTLKVKRSVHDPNGVSASLFDLVTDMCLYLRECNPPEDQQYSGMVFYEVWIPKMLSSYIEDSTSQSRLERILLSTIRSQPMEYFYQSKCRVFEGLVATRLYLMFSIGCVDDAMADTLSRLVTNWNEMNLRFSPDCIVYFMNSIHYSVASGESSRKTFGRNQWRLIVERVLEYQKIYIPIEPTSHSPDIMFQLHAKSGENRILFGIACKGRWSSVGMQWKNIIEEAEKFLIPVYEQVLSVHPSLHCVLVIISTKLSSSVSNAIEHTSCVYSAGSLIDNQLRIPPRCQLVILSEEDVEIILGKQVLSGLSSAFTISSDPVLKDIGISALEEFVGFMRKRQT